MFRYVAHLFMLDQDVTRSKATSEMKNKRFYTNISPAAVVTLHVGDIIAACACLFLGV